MLSRKDTGWNPMLAHSLIITISFRCIIVCMISPLLSHWCVCIYMYMLYMLFVCGGWACLCCNMYMLYMLFVCGGWASLCCN